MAALNEQSWSANYHFSDFGSGHAPGGLVVLSKVPIDYVGFTIEDHFVIGYGLDYQDRFRNVPYIGHKVR